MCAALAGAAAAAPDQACDDSEIKEGFLRSEDDELFGVLVQRYKNRIFRLVVSPLGPTAEAEAEDLLQEIFITVYRKLDTFRGDCKFSTCLYRLSRNRAIDGRRRHRPFTEVARNLPEGNSEPCSAVDLFTEIERSGRNSLVLRHVDRLGEPRRTVVFCTTGWGAASTRFLPSPRFRSEPSKAILAGRYDSANTSTARNARQVLADAGHEVEYIEVPEGHNRRPGATTRGFRPCSRSTTPTDGCSP